MKGLKSISLCLHFYYLRFWKMFPHPLKTKLREYFWKLVKNIANIGKHSKNVNGPILATETDPRGRFYWFENSERFKSFEIFDTVSNVNQNIWSIETFQTTRKRLKSLKTLRFVWIIRKHLKIFQFNAKIADPQIRGSNRFHGKRQLWKIRNSWPNWAIIAGTVLSNLEPLVQKRAPVLPSSLFFAQPGNFGEILGSPLVGPQDGHC